ncbi:hypothetical protein NQ317_010281 [Molorchus minor]|uniref:Uncharacterized protein n=1 Tax=Molorchus minor TaxID=1323400 RepID=A0ABQ9J487_9CUCU|nr:hypothetical protein NQ317_010281 [Molorchus minor]
MESRNSLAKRQDLGGMLIKITSLTGASTAILELFRIRICGSIPLLPMEVQRLGNKMAGGTNRKDATMALNGNNVQNNIKTKNNTDQQRKEKEKKDRESLVLWKRPLTTMEYFCREVSILITTYGKKLITHKKSLQ